MKLNQAYNTQFQLTAAITRLLADQMQDKKGRNLVRTLIGCMLFFESTMEILESCDTQASRVPSGEKATLWTHPPAKIKDLVQISTEQNQRLTSTLRWGKFGNKWAWSFNLSAPRSVSLFFVLLVHFLNVGAKDACSKISWATGKENVVWMPINGSHRWANGFLHVLAHPPVILLFKVAHRYEPRSTTHGKFVFSRRPTYTGGGSIDAQ